MFLAEIRQARGGFPPLPDPPASCAIGPLSARSGFHQYSKFHIFEKSYIRKVPSMNEALTPTSVFKCLADATRIRLMLLATREDELCVCELTCALDESQPKISRHLAQLRSGGLLADRRQGQWVYYRLHPDLPAWIVDTLTIMLEANPEWLVENDQRLRAMEDRPKRCC